MTPGRLARHRRSDQANGVGVPGKLRPVDGKVGLRDDTAAAREGSAPAFSADPAASGAVLVGLLERLDIGVAWVGREGVVRAHNAAARRLLRHLIDGETEWRGVLDQDGVAIAAESLPDLLGAGACAAMSRRVIGLPGDDNALAWVSLDIFPAAALDLALEGTIVVATDVTGARAQAKRLDVALKIFQVATQGFFLLDQDGRIIAANEASERITGYTEAEMAGVSPLSFCAPDARAALQETVDTALRAAGAWEGEFTAQQKSGASFRLWCAFTAFRTPTGDIEYSIVTLSDITEKWAAQERISFLVNFDPLTELPNRGMLDGWMDFATAEARRRQGRLAVLFVDLDNFKWVNDSLGHHVGDLLLIEVARRIKLVVRESDIVVRQGGDEFIVALQGLVDGREASRVAEKLLASFGQPILVEGHRLHVGASIGIAIFPEDGGNKDELLKNADAAMYEAKRAGRSQYAFFSPVLNAQAVTYARLAALLRSAVMRGAFDLVFQPQIDARTREITGLEALIRAQDPELGVPSVFIPVAERTGLIGDLGEWVIVATCRQIRQWLEMGFTPPTVAVNVSALQLRSQSLTKTIGEAVSFARIPHRCLEIEITETLLMERLDEAREALAWLRQHGIKVAIDDFGTGYSSLAYLQSLPIDRLKIDGSFVRELGGAGGGVVARAILGLAKSLSLEVVAEGVETEAQAELLTELGCGYFQGYHFGKPVPADMVPEICGWKAPEPA
jgi:diguanylate cyclase (GGDEF)-like protein/PAS domain S-box-containing protein